MNIINKIVFGFVLLFIAISCNAEKSQSGKPNVIIIYTDDQGAIDLNSYGATDLVTPNMDKIVNSGVKFT